MKILIIDDSPTMLASVEGMLSRGGHDVETALSAEDALGKLKAGSKPRLIITDLNMGTMNGIEFIRAAKKLPACVFTPMILLTTESQDEKRQEARAAGAAGWLVKPVTPDALLGVVKQLVPAG
jgi:two-component system chemotaxis response regulator CheY